MFIIFLRLPFSQLIHASACRIFKSGCHYRLATWNVFKWFLKNIKLKRKFDMLSVHIAVPIFDFVYTRLAVITSTLKIWIIVLYMALFPSTRGFKLFIFPAWFTAIFYPALISETLPRIVVQWQYMVFLYFILFNCLIALHRCL